MAVYSVTQYLGMGSSTFSVFSDFCLHNIHMHIIHTHNMHTHTQLTHTHKHTHKSINTPIMFVLTDATTDDYQTYIDIVHCFNIQRWNDNGPSSVNNKVDDIFIIHTTQQKNLIQCSIKHCIVGFVPLNSSRHFRGAIREQLGLYRYGGFKELWGYRK